MAVGVSPARRRVAAPLVALLASCCAPAGDRDGPSADPDAPAIRFEPARFSDLQGWTDDDHDAALAAFRRSCRWLLAHGSGRWGSAADWRPICAGARAATAARRFFERHFVPVGVAAGDGDPEGLMTGYFEPSLRGSREPDSRYDVPLYRRPPELVSVDLGQFRTGMRGRRVAGRVVGKALRPYHDRAAIAGGALAGRGLELVWVDSAVDAFFLQIQGSGKVRLRDGTVIRVGYDGFNGWPYTAIGRALVRSGAIARERMSMQAIRRWLAANPAEGRRLMNTNRSYVFFRELSGAGPVGTAGAVLTPGRSVAVDRNRIPLGMPLWLETAVPGGRPLKRLMVAQDTGGAITGAVRADVFWGAGARAAEIAGHMKSRGRYWLLVPKASTPTSRTDPPVSGRVQATVMR